MPKVIKEPSRTFNEYLLIPRYSSAKHCPDNISLRTPLVKYRKGSEPTLSLNIPFTSAVMQAVSDDQMAIALAKEGGLSFIYGSQSIKDQADMVKKVKSFKAGFVPSDTNIQPDQTLAELIDLQKQTGHSNTAVTDDGTLEGQFLGLVTSRDFRPDFTPTNLKIKDIMTPRDKLITAQDGLSLAEANDILWQNKLNTLPIVDKKNRLKYFVFRRDFDSHATYPNGLLDEQKRYLVGAGVNTRDYEKRIPALVDAGVDVLCIDSSEGYTEWQQRVIGFVRKKYGDSLKIGAGNVVDADGFRFLAEAGADFVKVGIGGGSICITREQKGIGRGQASAVLDVAEARDKYFKETGLYLPICSDGGIVHDYHMTLALAMGADFLMLGRYFARFEESPSNKLFINGNYVKEYWGEGSLRARNWQRYDYGGAASLAFEEGVDSYVPYAGHLHDNVMLSTEKIKSTMANCGVLSIAEFHQEAILTLVSSTSIVEGGAHDIIKKDSSGNIRV